MQGSYINETVIKFIGYKTDERDRLSTYYAYSIKKKLYKHN